MSEEEQLINQSILELAIRILESSRGLERATNTVTSEKK